MRYVVLKDNEVVNIIIWDGISELIYPFDYDEIITEEEYNKRFGDDW